MTHSPRIILRKSKKLNIKLTEIRRGAKSEKRMEIDHKKLQNAHYM